MKPTILLIEDNAAFRKLVAAVLAKGGYRILQAAAGVPGINKTVREQPDLVILDLVLPGMHGLDVCCKLKEQVKTAGIPILILTGNDREGQDITCLDMGADDYLSKPVKKERLLSHCRVLLRRSGRRSDVGNVRVGSLELDVSRKTAVLDGKTYPHLTPKEFDILYELAVNSPEPRDCDSLYRKLWGTEPPSEISLKAIAVHVRRIRLKLGWRSDQWLLGVRGRGYCLTPPQGARAP